MIPTESNLIIQVLQYCPVTLKTEEQTVYSSQVKCGGVWLPKPAWVPKPPGYCGLFFFLVFFCVLKFQQEF